MVTDQQVRKLMTLIQKTTNLEEASDKAGMSPRTAQKYRKIQKLPSECKPAHDWRTRPDPFARVWETILPLLKVNSGLQAKTIFEEIQRQHPGEFPDGQLRSLQRLIKNWRAVSGQAKEVFFPQLHTAGELCQSDFTEMNSLGVTIQAEHFRHLFYHLVMTYSNWETGSICFSESFESLSIGFQKAIWELGGIPRIHQTDRLSAAVNNMDNLAEFTQRYQELLRHYGIEGKRGNAGRGNENGDVEQRHHRFKVAVDQALMLRGSRDFKDRSDYECFLRSLLKRLNQNRSERFLEEVKCLKPLPASKLPGYTTIEVRVGPSSTIRVAKNTYSVHSRLIGETITAKLHAEILEIIYGQKMVDQFPRLRGEGHARINYRHIIDWLLRKPGAFEHYRYREELFPTSRFRMAYDWLKTTFPMRAHKEYLKILELAAKGNETAVDQTLERLLAMGQCLQASSVELALEAGLDRLPRTFVIIDPISLTDYDTLLESVEAA